MSEFIYWLGQGFGLMSFALGVSCFFQREDRRLKFFLFLLQLNNCVHFALLAAPTAVLSSLLAVIRTGLSLKTNSKIVAWLFIFISLALGVSLADNWGGMLPVVGACVGTYALFCLTGIRMRLAFLMSACFWLANNILVGSIGGTLLEVTLISVNSSTIFRMWRTQKWQGAERDAS